MTEKIKITRKTPAMQKIEKEFEFMHLTFEFKEVHFREDETWGKSYYTVSFIHNDEHQTVRFLHKKGHRTLFFFLQKALMTGGE